MALTNDELPFATIEELAPRIAAGDVSPVELTEAQLARIEAADGRLKSYATVMAESALAEARQAGRRSPRASTAGRCMESRSR